MLDLETIAKSAGDRRPLWVDRHPSKFIRYSQRALVTLVHDGDTVWAQLEDRGRWPYEKCRMYGYNSAELDTTKGKEDRDYMLALAEHRLALVEFVENDKYNRIDILLRVYIETTKEWVDVNHQMVATGHGVPYFAMDAFVPRTMPHASHPDAR